METCASCNSKTGELYQHWDDRTQKAVHPGKSLCSTCINGKPVTLLGKTHHLCLVCNGTFQMYVSRGSSDPVSLKQKPTQEERPLFATPSLEDSISALKLTVPKEGQRQLGDVSPDVDQGCSPFRGLTQWHSSGLTPSPTKISPLPAQLPGVTHHTGPMKTIILRSLTSGSPNSFSFALSCTSSFPQISPNYY